MATYLIPPTRTRDIQDRINRMADIFEIYSDQNASRMVTNALTNAGLPTLKVSQANIIKLMDYIVIPQMHSWEVGWSDNPSDINNPSMKGISLRTFVENFYAVFTSCGIPQVEQAARDWDQIYPAWTLEPEFAKVVLTLVCGRPKIGALYIYHTFCSSLARYPIAVMTEDPWLGFLLGQSVWSSGFNVYDSYMCDYDGVAASYGWNGLPNSWASFISSLGNQTIPFATQCFLKRYNYTMKASKLEGPNGIFRTAWLDRLLNDNNSDLLTLIPITENFCSNSKNIYNFSDFEKAHLLQKAANYRQISIVIPD